LAAIPDLTELAKRKPVAKKAVKIKKNTLVKALIFFKKNVGQFLIEENELTIGDTVLIKGALLENKF
jgi:UPF0176 protein